MTLLEVLGDNYAVCRNHLLSFLDLNDLLRIRRVSKLCKHVIEDYTRTKKIKTGRALGIDLKDDRPFEQHLKFQDTSSVLPQRENLIIWNFNAREKSFSMNRLFQSFLDTCYTTNITGLIIDGRAVPLQSKRLIQWLDSFPNVTHLKLRDFVVDNDEEEVPVGTFGSPSTPKESTIPTGLKNLQYLEMSPFSLDIDENARLNSFSFCVKLVQNYISNLECLDITFESFLRDQSIRLACLCLFNDYNIKLTGMDASFIEELLETDGRTPEMGTIECMSSYIDAKVTSIYCPQEMTFLLELPNLEKLEFDVTTLCKMPYPGFLRQEWPNLFELRVYFSDVEEENWDGTPSVTMLWDFLFVGIIRKKLTHFLISFDGFDEPNVTFPRTADILIFCPNLKILHLGFKVQELLVVSELWEGFTQLEELHFNCCSAVSDADFIGEDESSPVFWNLKRLKLLELTGMDRMKVTDKLFSNVLCHMQLKELIIHSYACVDSITLDGIESLLNGRFATTIEKLSMDLKGISSGEQDRVKKLFRSWQMI